MRAVVRRSLVLATGLALACSRASSPPPAAPTERAHDVALTTARDASAEIPPIAAPAEPDPGESPAFFALRTALHARLRPEEQARLGRLEARSPAAANARAFGFALSDLAIRTFVAVAFESAGDSQAAAAVRSLRAVTDRRTCVAALDVLTTVAGRARTNAGGTPTGPIEHAIRAAGNAGNACRVVARLEGVGTQESIEACDDLAAIASRSVCMRAAGMSTVAARAAGAMSAAADAASPGSRARVFESILDGLRELSHRN